MMIVDYLVRIHVPSSCLGPKCLRTVRLAVMIFDNLTGICALAWPPRNQFRVSLREVR
jgi:hypothetical protein